MMPLSSSLLIILYDDLTYCSVAQDIEGLEQEVMAGHDGAKDGNGRLISRIQMASINTQILGFKAWVQSLQDLLIVGHAMKIHGSESNVQAAGQLSVARLTRLETKSTYVLGQYREHRAIDTGVAATAPGMMEPFPPHRPLHGAPSNMPPLPSLKEEQNRKAKTCAVNAQLDTKNKQVLCSLALRYYNLLCTEFLLVFPLVESRPCDGLPSVLW